VGLGIGLGVGLGVGLDVGLGLAFIPNGQLQPTRSRLAARDVANLISCIALTLSSSDLPGGK